MLKEAAGTVSQHVQFGCMCTYFWVPSGRSKYFDIRSPRFGVKLRVSGAQKDDPFWNFSHFTHAGAHRISTVARVDAALGDRHSCQIHSAPTRCGLGAFSGEGEVLSQRRVVFPTIFSNRNVTARQCAWSANFSCSRSVHFSKDLRFSYNVSARLFATLAGCVFQLLASSCQSTS